MISIIKGNIFDSGCEVLVNPVNCQGIMGRGLARDMKKYNPHHFKVYQEMCEKKEMKIGKPVKISNIICFPTKKEWFRPSELYYIALGLPRLEDLIHAHSIKSIAIPALGCGLGELKWFDVKDLLEDWAELINLPDTLIKVYAPLE